MASSSIRQDGGSVPEFGSILYKLREVNNQKSAYIINSNKVNGEEEECI
jgi:hypothetical protein